MILDSDNAERLYLDYQYGDVDALEELLLEASPLMEVIALSVCPEHQEDLVQEARLKLMSICIEDTYKPSRGSMYTFLSSALKFHMIDVLRKGPREEPDEDCEDYPDNGVYHSDGIEVLNGDDIVEYSIYRYPSVHGSVAVDATEYVLSTMPESIQEGSRGIIRTLCIIYNVDRHLGRTMYFGTMTVARMDAMGMDWLSNVCDAIELVECDGVESSLLPEVVLLLGKEQAATMQSIFCGSYVKF